MVLFYDIDGDHADHDDWHSNEHFAERLGVPGFIRATRWVATRAATRYLVTYEVADVDVATSAGYLERLNQPSPWTSRMMPRFRGMTRGFCNVLRSEGFGLGAAAAVLRFTPGEGSEADLTDWIGTDILPALAERREVAGAHLLRPAPPPPMTREQSLRGADNPMSWLVLATACDAAALEKAVDELLDNAAFRQHGAAQVMTPGFYGLHQTATAEEVRAVRV
ncbi:MAG: hypothetical protein ACMVY4_16580 [Minwuia sp.]|uniref:hypothetical protein n=1 Tax=Minwuia sp. TaxID=2493630 RepID=UPI003A89040E